MWWRETMNPRLLLSLSSPWAWPCDQHDSPTWSPCNPHMPVRGLDGWRGAGFACCPLLLSCLDARIITHAPSPLSFLPTQLHPLLSHTQSTMTTNISKKRKFIADGVFYAELNEVRAGRGLRRGEGGEGGGGGVDRAGGQQHAAAQEDAVSWAGGAGLATAALAGRPLEAACGGWRTGGRERRGWSGKGRTVA